MMKKFRIEFSDVYVLEDNDSELFDETYVLITEITFNSFRIAEYNTLINMLNNDDEHPRLPLELTNKCLYRTRKMMKQRELMLEYSKASSLVIATLPLATEQVLKTPLWYLWLELLSKNMPPTLFVRGNQTSVLTYYS